MRYFIYLHHRGVICAWKIQTNEKLDSLFTWIALIHSFSLGLSSTRTRCIGQRDYYSFQPQSILYCGPIGPNGLTWSEIGNLQLKEPRTKTLFFLCSRIDPTFYTSIVHTQTCFRQTDDASTNFTKRHQISNSNANTSISDVYACFFWDNIINSCPNKPRIHEILIFHRNFLSFNQPHLHSYLHILYGIAVMYIVMYGQ